MFCNVYVSNGTVMCHHPSVIFFFTLFFPFHKNWIPFISSRYIEFPWFAILANITFNVCSSLGNISTSGNKYWCHCLTEILIWIVFETIYTRYFYSYRYQSTLKVPLFTWMPDLQRVFNLWEHFLYYWTLEHVLFVVWKTCVLLIWYIIFLIFFLILKSTVSSVFDLLFSVLFVLLTVDKHECKKLPSCVEVRSSIILL